MYVCMNICVRMCFKLNMGLHQGNVKREPIGSTHFDIRNPDQLESITYLFT